MQMHFFCTGRILYNVNMSNVNVSFLRNQASTPFNHTSFSQALTSWHDSRSSSSILSTTSSPPTSCGRTSESTCPVMRCVICCSPKCPLIYFCPANFSVAYTLCVSLPNRLQGRENTRSWSLFALRTGSPVTTPIPDTACTAWMLTW